tara:strand:- start:9732 stop:10682 length:951 start_codon:yes stop_codon:yes gene_type:complete
MIFATLAITFGIALIWFSAEKLEKYSVLTAQQFGFSPFFIGSTVIAFGTSAPEMLTTLFVSLENKGQMVIGNVIGSNVANLSLVFGSMLLIVSLKQLKISQDASIKKNLLILIVSSLLVWAVIAIDPFNITSSMVLLSTLFLVILYWYKNGVAQGAELKSHTEHKNVALKLFIALTSIVCAAYLITFGANQILEKFNLGQLFIGYTVLAIGTSLPEIAASVSLALKGRYETVSGTLIGSNIFNGLCVLAIPGLFMREEMSEGWSFFEWSPLLFILFVITFIFASYTFSLTIKERNASVVLSLLFLSSYFVSLYYAY